MIILYTSTLITCPCVCDNMQGVGKGHVLSWLSAQKLFPLEYVVHVDPDFFKSIMPEWPSYREVDEEQAGSFCHAGVYACRHVYVTCACMCVCTFLYIVSCTVQYCTAVYEWSCITLIVSRLLVLCTNVQLYYYREHLFARDCHGDCT